MQYTDFNGEKISKLGFGLMRLPVVGGDPNAVDYDKASELVMYAVENGVNYFDTAYTYHDGESEKFIGRVVAENNLKGKINIADKLFTMSADKPDYDPKKLFDIQMERLKTGHIEFFLLHGLRYNKWEILRDKFHILEFLDDLKSQGVVDHIGFSFHDEYEAFEKILNEFETAEFAQIQYNYVDRDFQAGARGLKLAEEKGVKISIMEPLKGGGLIFADYPEVREIMNRHGLENMSCAELGLDFVYDSPGIFTVLSGMNGMDMVKENIAIASRAKEGVLTEAMKGAIAEICEVIENYESIPCTACRYCVKDCPVGIDIPSAFKFYNMGKKFRSPTSQRRNYDRTCRNLKDCVECGQCAEACPQHLEIPKLLKEVRAYLE